MISNSWAAITLLAGLLAGQTSQPAGAPPVVTTAPATVPATMPATTPTTVPTTVPATTPTSMIAMALDPVTNETLDKLETAGKMFRTIVADINFGVEELAFADVEIRTGQVSYAQGTPGKAPSRFRIHFATVKQGATGPKVADNVDYAFDGEWFTTRKEKIKELAKFQVAEPGKPVDALKLGKGPFPVPFGQEKAEVLRRFVASSIPSAPADPKGTVHLQLLPRDKSGQDMDIRKLDMWINAAGLPEKIVSEDARGQKITTVVFSNIQTNKPLGPEVFNLPSPTDPNWRIRIEPLRPNTPIQ